MVWDLPRPPRRARRARGGGALEWRRSRPYAVRCACSTLHTRRVSTADRGRSRSLMQADPINRSGMKGQRSTTCSTAIAPCRALRGLSAALSGAERGGSRRVRSRCTRCASKGHVRAQPGVSWRRRRPSWRSVQGRTGRESCDFRLTLAQAVELDTRPGCRHHRRALRASSSRRSHGSRLDRRALRTQPSSSIIQRVACQCVRIERQLHVRAAVIAAATKNESDFVTKCRR